MQTTFYPGGKRTFKIGRRWAAGLVVWALGLGVPGAQAQTGGNQLASLNEDVQLLTRQVSQLRLEVESLRQSNAELQKQVLTQKEVQTMIQNAVAQSRSEMKADAAQANAALRKEIIDEVAKQIKALTKETNDQFDKLTKAMAVAPGPGNNVKAIPVNFPDDYPKTGVTYTVVSGDNIATLARKYNSTERDIQNANGIADPAKGLMAGKTIFIPQKNPSRPPPSGAAPGGN